MFQATSRQPTAAKRTLVRSTCWATDIMPDCLPRNVDGDV